MRLSTTWKTVGLLGCGVLAAFTAARAGDNPGDTVVLPVKDGKKAAFLLRFDDAHNSQLGVVVPALRERGMVGTFFIFDRKEQVHDKKAGWIKAAESGVVVFGNHTFAHKYIQDSHPDRDTAVADLSKLNDLIHELTPGQPWPRIIAYANAGGKTPADRGIGRAGVDAILKELHMVRAPDFWGAGIHVKDAAAMKKIVDRSVENGTMGHLDFHGVGGQKTQGINASRDDFLAFLDHLEERKPDLWITDAASYRKYEIEKETAKAVGAVAGNAVTVTLTADTGPLFDQPLTLETRVPEGWTAVTAVQGDRRATAPVANGVVRYDAVPNAGDVVLTKVD